MIKRSAAIKSWSSVLLVLMSTGCLWACSRIIPIGEPRRDDTAQATDQKKDKPDKALQSFETIPGTPYLIAHITQQGWGKSRSASSESYKRGGGEIRNLVFLDSESLASHRLFETNQYTILEAQQYSLGSPEPQGKNNKQSKKTDRFVYQVVKQDTNENDYLDAGDHRIIGISDAFGKQYLEVLTDISQLLNLQIIGSDKLLAIYIKNGSKTASIIDLNQRTVVKTNAIANLGPKVK